MAKWMNVQEFVEQGPTFGYRDIYRGRNGVVTPPRRYFKRVVDHYPTIGPEWPTRRPYNIDIRLDIRGIVEVLMRNNHVEFQCGPVPALLQVEKHYDGEFRFRLRMQGSNGEETLHTANLRREAALECPSSDLVRLIQATVEELIDTAQKTWETEIIRAQYNARLVKRQPVDEAAAKEKAAEALQDDAMKALARRIGS